MIRLRKMKGKIMIFRMMMPHLDARRIFCVNLRNRNIHGYI